MGNCIGKKSDFHHQQRRHSSSFTTIPSVQRSLKPIPSFKLALPLNPPLERHNIVLSHLSDVKETSNNHISNENDQSKSSVIQYSSTSTNEQFLLIHSPSSVVAVVSPVQLTNEYKKLKSSKTVIVLSENDMKQPFTLLTNEQDTTMGHLFNKANDINKENDNSHGNDKVNTDIKVHTTDNERNKTHQYFTIINDKNLSHRNTMFHSPEIVQDPIETSLASSLFDSSLSSLSCNTTPFSSQDRLILSSSSSSSVISPVTSTVLTSPPPLPPSSSSSSSHFNKIPPNSRALSYFDQIYLNNQSSSLLISDEIFPTVLPVSSSSSRHQNDLFLNEFHQNILTHPCKTLRTVIDNVIQQQFIRIHQASKVILIEHKELQCVHLKDAKRFHTPSLIFDDQQKLIYLTKHARSLGLQSFTCTTQHVPRLPKLFSSCEQCSTLLSGSKLHQRIRPFLLVNATHDLVQKSFNETTNNTIFGYISQKNPKKIRQILVNNCKFAYSYDLDVCHTSSYFVLRVHSWPQDIRQTFEQRHRLWPKNLDTLFDETCFLRIDTHQCLPSTINKCLTCEKLLSTSADSTWSYTYTAIEAQLIHQMTDEQIRFGSIVWNYLNSKTQGQLPFNLFKHTLFFFFEQYSSDCFISSDLLTYTHLFTDYLFNRLQEKFLPHYFNSNYNLYHEHLSITLMSSISIKMTYLDLKNFAIYLLPKSSSFLYQLIYLIQFQSHFLQCLLACTASKTNSIQTIIDTHELVLKQFSTGIQTYKRQLDTHTTMKIPLTIDCLYRYQEENVQIILDYLPLLRDKEPSLLIHSFWSMFIQYFNCLFDDLFIS